MISAVNLAILAQPIAQGVATREVYYLSSKAHTGISFANQSWLVLLLSYVWFMFLILLCHFLKKRTSGLRVLYNGLRYFSGRTARSPKVPATASD